MGTFGAGPFSSDGAQDFLALLAGRPPERRAAALEDLFRLARERPELLWREFFPDEVVAAAAVVAATLPGGRPFDPAAAARLPAPAPDLADAAAEAVRFVAGPRGPWHQGWVSEAYAAEARDTIAALLQVLTLGRGRRRDELDAIWNAAADYGADGEVPEGTPRGIEHLAALLRVYNSAMGGGVGFALEVNEPFRVRRAVAALRYFGLGDAADFLDDVPVEATDEEFYELVDDVVERAFRAKAAEVPDEFGLV